MSRCAECGAPFVPAETPSAYLEAAQDRLHARVEAALDPLSAGPERPDEESVSAGRQTPRCAA